MSCAQEAIATRVEAIATILLNPDLPAQFAAPKSRVSRLYQKKAAITAWGTCAYPSLQSHKEANIPTLPNQGTSVFWRALVKDSLSVPWDSLSKPATSFSLDLLSRSREGKRYTVYPGSPRPLLKWLIWFCCAKSLVKHIGCLVLFQINGGP